MKNIEEKIAGFASVFVGGSLVFAVAGLIIVFGVAQVAAGDTSILTNPFTQMVAVFAFLYGLSIYLLSTLAGKSKKRRLVSWMYSIVFHSALLLYLGIGTGFHGGMFVLCLAESAILSLSVAGLGAFAFNSRHQVEV